MDEPERGGCDAEDLRGDSGERGVAETEVSVQARGVGGGERGRVDGEGV